MWEWIGENAEKLGAGILGVGGLFAAIWQFLLKARTEKAKAGADVAIAASQGEVFTQMKERLSDLADSVARLTVQVDGLRDQVRDREMEIHRLQMYVKDLEHALQQAGIPLPTMRI